MPTDRELVRQLLDGREEAFEQLVRRHEVFVTCVLANRTWTPRHDLEDLVQEVWVKLWRNNYNALMAWHGLIEGPETVSVRPYIRTIAIHILLDHPPPPEEQRKDDDDGLPASSPPYVEPGDAERVLRAARRVCSNRDYKILRLYYSDGATIDDIACRFNIGERGVRTVLHRCRRRIREQLGLE
jgi:RNA polymerase sigma factor (sigma-70 family)